MRHVSSELAKIQTISSAVLKDFPLSCLGTMKSHVKEFEHQEETTVEDRLTKSRQMLKPTSWSLLRATYSLKAERK